MQNGLVSFRASAAVEGVCVYFQREGGTALQCCTVGLDRKHRPQAFLWFLFCFRLSFLLVHFSVYPDFCCLHMRLSEMTGIFFPFIFKNEVLQSCLDIVCLVVNLSVEKLGKD